MIAPGLAASSEPGAAIRHLAEGWQTLVL